jgi:hypothetical protein
MQYKLIVWRDCYGIFETDETGRVRGKPLELHKDLQKVAKRVRELNDAQPVPEPVKKKKK